MPPTCRSRLRAKPAGSCLRASRLWFLRPNEVQHAVKMSPKWLPGGVLECHGLLEASWSRLGGLLERSWMALGPKESPLDRLFAAPRGISRQFSAILTAKKVPKRSPGGSKIGSRRRLELKRAKSQNFEDVSRNSLISKVPGPLF